MDTPSTSKNDPETENMAQSNLEQWAIVSNFLWWTVFIVCLASLPLLKYALYQMLLKYRKSHYFYFLVSMIVLDIAMLISILINILADSSIPALKGNLMCKLTAFITNMTACYINWLWVVMFAQRFAYVFFPMQTIKPHGVFRIFDEARILIIMTGMIAVSTQAWWPLIMKEIHIVSNDGRVQGTYCGADTKLMAKNLFKWLGLADSMFTYAVPFSITLLTDMAVLVCRTQDNKKFKLLSSNNMINGNSRMMKLTASTRRQFQSFKIQSEESKKASNERRQREIRRCLTIATAQLVLNLPNYILQLVDEFVSLQSSNSLMYLYADATFYLIYLTQFPMLAVYVHLLHGNMNKSKRYNKKNMNIEKTCSTSLL